MPYSLAFCETNIFLKGGSAAGTQPIAAQEHIMKMNPDFANKTIKNLQAEVDALLQEESVSKTYSYSASEQPQIPPYNFAETQKKLGELRGKIATIRHALNRFNVKTKVPGYDMTVDEALGQMSLLHKDKQRFQEMSRIPEKNRTREFGSKDADYVCRNFNVDEVKAAYASTSEQLMRIQQAINIVNLTKEFEVDIEL